MDQAISREGVEQTTELALAGEGQAGQVAVAGST